MEPCEADDDVVPEGIEVDAGGRPAPTAFQRH